MEKSSIYDLLGYKVLHKWRQDILEEINFGYSEKERELKQKLQEQTSDKRDDTLRAYRLVIEERMDELYYNINIKMLNLGIQIGLEVQAAIDSQSD